jgi:hypothetical protein
MDNLGAGVIIAALLGGFGFIVWAYRSTAVPWATARKMWLEIGRLEREEREARRARDYRCRVIAGQLRAARDAVECYILALATARSSGPAETSSSSIGGQPHQFARSFDVPRAHILFVSPVSGRD